MSLIFNIERLRSGCFLFFGKAGINVSKFVFLAKKRLLVTDDMFYAIMRIIKVLVSDV